MKRLLLLSSLLPLLAWAGEPAPGQAPVLEPAPLAQTTVDAAQLDPEDATQLDADRNCLRYTGSLVSAAQARRAEREARRAARAAGEAPQRVAQLDRDGCVAAHGRVYSREDLRRTGEVDIADALRRLDPAIR